MVGDVTTFLALVEPEIGESVERPGALARVAPDGSDVALLVGPDTWVSEPSLIRYVVNGEPGAQQIGEEQALDLVARFPWPGIRPAIAKGAGAPARAADVDYIQDERGRFQGSRGKGGDAKKDDDSLRDWTWDSAKGAYVDRQGRTSRELREQEAAEAETQSQLVDADARAQYAQVEDGQDLGDYITDHFTSDGHGGGSSNSEWFKDPVTGDQYLVKSGEIGYNEGVNELIAAEMLGETSLLSSDVRIAGDVYDDDYGNFPVAVSHIENREDVDEGSFEIGGDINLGPGNTVSLEDSAKEDVIRIAMFDEVVQNQDGHPGNYGTVIDSNGDQRVVAIDNSLILGGRGGPDEEIGDSMGNVQYPDPAPMADFSQYNSDRHDMARGVGASLPREQVEDVYDETVADLARGVDRVSRDEFTDQFAPNEMHHTAEMVGYMESQVQGLRDNRDANIAWLMGESLADVQPRERGPAVLRDSQMFDDDPFASGNAF